MPQCALQIQPARHNRVMNNDEDTQNQSASDEQDADSYYGEEDMASGDLDLSFLDEEADEGEERAKSH
jgi:hypothetical protein